MYATLDRHGRNSNAPLAILIGLVLIVGGLVGAWIFTGRQQVEDEGQRVDAQVVGTRHYDKPGMRTAQKYYYITVRFTPPGKQPEQGEYMVGSGDYEEFKAASPHSPMSTQMVFDSANNRWQPLPGIRNDQNTLAWIGGGFACMGVLMVLIGVRGGGRRLDPQTVARSMVTDQPPGSGTPAHKTGEPS